MKRALLLLLACACSPTDVVVASIEAGPDGPPFRTCVGNQDCSPNEFCERARCDDVTGGCAPRPIMCDESSSPVCGCDGTTYWNDCVRKSNAATSATQGSCDTSALTCDDATPCPSGAYCARLYPQGQCDTNGSGACWVLPLNCPEADAGDGLIWMKCPATPLDCASTCDAIRSQATYASAQSCP